MNRETYLIVIEAEGAGSARQVAYHHQPYRLASSRDEAQELMLDYMRLGPDSGALVPEFFLLYKEKDGEFGEPEYLDPCSTALEPAGAGAFEEWMQRTGRI